MVVDAGTHAVQWTYGSGFGTHLNSRRFREEGINGISAPGWQFVYLRRWPPASTLVGATPQDIGAIDVADVDNHDVQRLLLAMVNGVRPCHDLMTQALKWEANNPEHGVTKVTIGDVDNDGVVDLLWGAGATSSGPDYLYVANTTGGHDIKWQNLDLEGPFLGPAIGELDGDGQPELVICSTSSDAGYSGGYFSI
jgi:hypothetical protein